MKKLAVGFAMLYIQDSNFEIHLPYFVMQPLMELLQNGWDSFKLFPPPKKSDLDRHGLNESNNLFFNSESTGKPSNQEEITTV